jgi:effector-binding domain-containing protein
MPYEIEVETLLPQKAYAIRATAPADRVGEKVKELLPEIFEFILSNGSGVAGMPFARYLRSGGDEVEIEAGIPVVRGTPVSGHIQLIELHGGSVAVMLHVGSHEELPQAHAKLKAWVREKGKSAMEASWEEYVTGPGDETDPQKWETRVCQPIL